MHPSFRGRSAHSLDARLGADLRRRSWWTATSMPSIAFYWEVDLWQSNVSDVGWDFGRARAVGVNCVIDDIGTYGYWNYNYTPKQALRLFETALRYAERNSDKMAIVTTVADARRVIDSGRSPLPGDAAEVEGSLARPCCTLFGRQAETGGLAAPCKCGTIELNAAPILSERRSCAPLSRSETRTPRPASSAAGQRAAVSICSRAGPTGTCRRAGTAAPSSAVSIEYADGHAVHDLAKMPGQMQDWKINCVCGGTRQSCNGGWMKDIEDRAKPISLPLIRGEEARLTDAEQRVVATWAVLKTMVANHEAVSPEHLQVMYKDHAPPPEGWAYGSGTTSAAPGRENG